MTLTGGVSVLQVHPTRRCNLQCAHCYSSSGPREQDTITSGRLVELIAAAGRLGYRQLSVSGGEPLLYPDLAALLLAGRSAGMTTTMTTNAMLASEHRLRPLTGLLDAIAISLDGVPSTHNALRGHPDAFARMERNLPALRNLNAPIGFIFTLTRHNAHELLWVVDFCRRVGASFLQIHPLTPSGRGSNLGDAVPDEIELAAAVWAAEQLGRESGIAVHVDAVAADERLDPAMFVPSTDAPLHELASPLIVLPDGEIVPMTHDINPALRLGNVHDDDLESLALAWMDSHRPSQLIAAARDAFARLIAPGAPELVYWYDVVATASAIAGTPLTLR